MKAAWAAVLCSLMAAASARAEPLYVIDQLVLGVSSAPGGAGGRVANIRSGDRVEVLERQGEEAHIRLANGLAGWVKASYLSPELPLQRRLSERTAEVQKLRKNIDRLEAQLLGARAPQASPGATVTATPDPPPPINLPASRSLAAWGWVLGSAVLALVAGFIAGWRTLDRRIRQRYGGLRIY